MYFVDLEPYWHIHGGEARDLKWEIPGTPHTVRICISLIFSLIMVGFALGLLQTI